MKALLLEQYNNLIYTDVPEPEMGPRDVIVKVEACGICGSDVHGIDGSTGRRIPPIIMGHEACGVIADVGADAGPWTVGQRVAFDSTVYCGECWYCRRGEVNLCGDRKVLGVSCPDFRRHGAYAEYISVPKNILYKLPDSVSFVQGALVEPVAIAYHGIRLADVKLGDFAVVVGAGPIGIIAVQILRAAGCREVAAVEIDEERLSLASQLGATVLLNPKKDDVPQRVMDMTEGRGADVVIEAVGAEITINTAISCARKGGCVVVVGMLAPSIQMPILTVVNREIALQGSCSFSEGYTLPLDMIGRGVVNVDPLISLVAPLSEGVDVFNRLLGHEKGLIKAVLRP